MSAYFQVRLASFLARLILFASFLLLKRIFSLHWIRMSVRMYLILLFSSLSVLVRLSSSQGQQDHSLDSPHTEYENSEGQPEEPVQDK